MQQLRRNIFLFTIALITFGVNAQDTTNLDAMTIRGKKAGFKTLGLYDGDFEEEYNIRGYTQLNVFDGSLTDYWTTDGSSCISGKLADDGITKSLRVEWNQGADGCDWVGMGFGWDGWTGKDMAYVIDTLALEITVRSLDKPFTNIPWAFCFEDYSGGQAWLGYNAKFLKSKSITKEWSKIVMPLQLFPFEENGVDATSIKQLLIQVFSDGDIDIKSMKLIPFSGKLKNSCVAKTVDMPIKIDGSLEDWSGHFNTFGNGHQFAVSYSEDSLYFAFNVQDKSPLENAKTGGDLWQGDAIEIAFSTNPSADPKRSFYLLSDQQIGINCGTNPYVWDFKRNVTLSSANVQISPQKDGYIMEIALPCSTFYQFKPQPGQNLDLEVAIDLGTIKGRQDQVRWNSGADEGFHKSPAKWGELFLK